MDIQTAVIVIAAFLIALVLGGMAFFSFVMAPLVHAKLPSGVASRFIRQTFPVYYRTMAVLTVLSTVTLTGRYEAIAMGFVAALFLFALFWILPRVEEQAAQRSHQGQETADGVAERPAPQTHQTKHTPSFIRLHSLSVMINFVQFIMIAGIFIALLLSIIRM